MGVSRTQRRTPPPPKDVKNLRNNSFCSKLLHWGIWEEEFNKLIHQLVVLPLPWAPPPYWSSRFASHAEAEVERHLPKVQTVSLTSMLRILSFRARGCAKNLGLGVLFIKSLFLCVLDIEKPFFFFLIFMTVPKTYGSYWARDWTWAAATATRGSFNPLHQAGDGNPTSAAAGTAAVGFLTHSGNS